MGLSLSRPNTAAASSPDSMAGTDILLDVRNVRKVFPDARREGVQVVALGGISIAVPRSQFVCLLGPSGCGKTTLIRIVAGLDQANSGEVLLNGQPIAGPGRDRSMVFQNYGLLPWRTVLGNVEFSLEIQGMSIRERREVAMRQIQKLNLTGFEHHFPHQLSGGMQQRVGLARALTKDPVILLMDEPFAAVDMHTREYLQEELLNIWRTIRTTVLFVTHSIDEAVYLGDRVLVMSARPGRVRADVTIDLPRPREVDIKSSPRFGELCQALRDALRTEESGQGATDEGR